MSKIVIIWSLGTLFLCVAMLSCSSDDDEIDCSTVDPGPNWFEMGFFDSQNNSLLVTEYTQESFRLFNEQEELFISPWATGSPEYLIVRYNEITSNRTYYIELSETDTDTLKFLYSERQGPCFPIYSLEQVDYNGDIYVIENSLRVPLLKE